MPDEKASDDPGDLVIEPNQVLEAQHERAEAAAIGTQWERLQGILVRAEKVTTTSHDRAGLLEDAVELAKRLSHQQQSFAYLTQALVHAGVGTKKKGGRKPCKDHPPCLSSETVAAHHVQSMPLETLSSALSTR